VTPLAASRASVRIYSYDRFPGISDRELIPGNAYLNPVGYTICSSDQKIYVINEMKQRLIEVWHPCWQGNFARYDFFTIS